MENNQITIQEDEISLKELLFKVRDWVRYLFSKWYILLIALFLGSCLGLLYATYKKPMYTATTTFVLEGGEQGGGLSQYAGMAAMVGLDLGGAGGGLFQGENILELYKSRKMIEATLLNLSSTDSSKTLLEYYFEMNNMRNKWLEKPDLSSIDYSQAQQENLIKQRKRDSVVNVVVENIRTRHLIVGKPDKKLSIIKVDVLGTSEIFAKEFNESLVNEVNSFYIQTKTKKSQNNIEILQEKTDSVRAVMNGAISSAVVAIDNTPNLNPTKQAQRLVPSQRSQFSAETNKAILGQLVQNLEMSKMALMKELPLIQVIDTPVYPIKMERIGKLKGLIFGAFIGFVLSSFLLTVVRIYKSIVK